MIFDPKQPVYIVGGGASLADFDWRKLDDKQTIVVNTAYRKIKPADVFYFADDSFFKQHGDWQIMDVWRAQAKRIFSSAPCFSGVTNETHPKSRVEYLPKETFEYGGESFAKSNSGIHAILLARQLGAETVVLLGFDNKRGHWHDGTPLAHHRTIHGDIYERYAEHHRRLAAVVDFKVLNAGPDSELDAWPIIALGDEIEKRKPRKVKRAKSSKKETLDNGNSDS